MIVCFPFLSHEDIQAGITPTLQNYLICDGGARYTLRLSLNKRCGCGTPLSTELITVQLFDALNFLFLFDALFCIPSRRRAAPVRVSHRWLVFKATVKRSEGGRDQSAGRFTYDQGRRGAQTGRDGTRLRDRRAAAERKTENK
jgi:hypothetical protein